LLYVIVVTFEDNQSRVFFCDKKHKDPDNLKVCYLTCNVLIAPISAWIPLDPTAAVVLGISNLLFWVGIIIVVVVAIGWIVYDWYIDRKTTRSIRSERRKK
jgi:hypothetical protein